MTVFALMGHVRHTVYVYIPNNLIHILEETSESATQFGQDSFPTQSVLA